MIENEIRSAVGLPLQEIKQTECSGHWCEMVIHAKPHESGTLKQIEIEEDIKNRYVKMIDISVKSGDFVKPFTGANMALGNLFLRFDTRKELDEVTSRVNDWLHIELEK